MWRCDVTVNRRVLVSHILQLHLIMIVRGSHLRYLNDNSITGPLPKEWSAMMNLSNM
jgi:hypothetical protein